MDLIVVGMNHTTAPVEVREGAVFSDEEAGRTLSLMKEDNVLFESMILSTCNRTEVYGVGSSENILEEYICKLLNKIKDIEHFNNLRYYYVHRGKDTVRHLFRVVSGLDSMVIGETQIFGQVKDAYKLSYECKTTGIFLNKIMHWAFRTGKRVRSETSMGTGAVSVSLAGCELAQKIFTDLSKRKVLLIGAGETGELTAKHLIEKGIGKLFITNRTFENAENIAGKLGGEAIPFEKYIEKLPIVDIIISSTGSQKPIVDYDTINKCMEKRNNRPLFIIDIAVPRDFAYEIGDIENVFLHNIDDLKVIVDKNVKKREMEIPKVEKIIECEVNGFFEWYESLESAPVIKLLLDRFEELRKMEFEHHKKKFLKEDWEQLEMFTKHFIQTLLHNPINKLKTTNENIYSKLHILSVIKDVFDLYDKKCDK